jgi:hypothetical protein
VLYDDGRVALDDNSLVIRRYYLWGDKRIPYTAIQSLGRFSLDKLRGRWRLWGSGDFKHWYNLDRSRPKKSVGFEIHTAARTVPVITPDDPDAVERILTEHGVN